jgi:hypothetical protein
MAGTILQNVILNRNIVGIQGNKQCVSDFSSRSKIVSSVAVGAIPFLVETDEAPMVGYANF